MFDHESYLSPLTWRYGSAEMRQVWSEAQKRRLLRRFWVALAEAQAETGLVSAEQVADLRAHQTCQVFLFGCILSLLPFHRFSSGETMANGNGWAAVLDSIRDVKKRPAYLSHIPAKISRSPAN